MTNSTCRFCGVPIVSHGTGVWLLAGGEPGDVACRPEEPEVWHQPERPTLRDLIEQAIPPGRYDLGREREGLIDNLLKVIGPEIERLKHVEYISLWALDGVSSYLQSGAQQELVKSTRAYVDQTRKEIRGGKP